MFALVELAGCHTQAPKEEQTHAEDGEDAGRSHCTCRTGNGAGSVPSIAPAAGAAGTSCAQAGAQEELFNATLSCCCWGRVRGGTGPPEHPLLVPELPACSGAQHLPYTPCDYACLTEPAKTLNVLRFPSYSRNFFLQSRHTVSTSNLPSRYQTHHPQSLATDVTRAGDCRTPLDLTGLGRNSTASHGGQGPLGPQTTVAALKANNSQTNTPRGQQKVVF